jgi:hypothetical protein
MDASGVAQWKQIFAHEVRQSLQAVQSGSKLASCSMGAFQAHLFSTRNEADEFWKACGLGRFRHTTVSVSMGVGRDVYGIKFDRNKSRQILRVLEA